MHSRAADRRSAPDQTLDQAFGLPERLRHDPAMRWIVGGKAVVGRAASPSQIGRFETQWLATDKNLSALADLSGQWIDLVHGRRPPRGIVFDMDSSVSPTHGEQENSVWNGHYACTCYHPLFVFNQFGDLERCALRPGNVHSADGWKDVLDPVVQRYRGKVTRIYFRADAAFAMPEAYEFLEAERIKYAIRLPANQVLQGRIGYLLKRPIGRPPNEVRRFHANFSYQAATWTKPRRVITGSSGVRANCIRASACLLQQTRDVQAMDQGMQGRDQVDAAVVPDLCRKRGAASGSCACLQLPKNGSDMKQCIAAAALCLFATAANALVITPPNKQCDANSYVHKPLSPTHPLDPNSAAIVAGLNAQSPSSTSIRPTMPPRFSWSGISTRSSPIIKAPLLGSSPPRRN